MQHDGTRENMGVLWKYVEGNGRMVDLYTDRAAMFMVTPRPGESAQQRREADRNNGECDCASVRDLEEVRFPLRGGGRLPIKGVLDGPHRALQIAQFAPEKRKRT